MKNNGEYLTFTSQKTRGTPAFEFNSPVDWPTLKISQEDAILPAEEGEDEKPKESARDIGKKDEGAPWT